MNIEFLSIAEGELFDAISFYNSQSEGLGFEFASEVRQTIVRITQFPDAWAVLSDVLAGVEPSVSLTQ